MNNQQPIPKNKPVPLSTEDLIKKLRIYFNQQDFLQNQNILKSIISQNSLQVHFSILIGDQQLYPVDPKKLDEALKTLGDVVIYDPFTGYITPQFKLERTVIHFFGLKGDKQNQFFEEVLKAHDPEIREKTDQYEIFVDKENIYIGALEGSDSAKKLFNFLFSRKFEGQSIDMLMCDELTIKKIQTPVAPIQTNYYMQNFYPPATYQTNFGGYQSNRPGVIHQKDGGLNKGDYNNYPGDHSSKKSGGKGHNNKNNRGYETKGIDKDFPPLNDISTTQKQDTKEDSAN